MRLFSEALYVMIQFYDHYKRNQQGIYSYVFRQKKSYSILVCYQCLHPIKQQDFYSGKNFVPQFQYHRTL